MTPARLVSIGLILLGPNVVMFGIDGRAGLKPSTEAADLGGQRVIRVSAAVAVSGDGSSWDMAYASLQDALTAASSGDEIWVAAGTYHPDSGGEYAAGNREASFEVTQPLGLFGGFAGFESDRGERDPEANITRLSGDLLENDSEAFDPFAPERGDNSRSIVVITSSLDEEMPVIDGFEISGGHMSIGSGSGGGVRIEAVSHADLRNLTIQHNFAALSGGGLLSLGTFNLTNSRITQNAARTAVAPADGLGGGLHHSPDERQRQGIPSARIDGVEFRNNLAGKCGGGLHVASPEEAADASLVTLLVTNSGFHGNVSEQSGGGICLTGALPSPRVVALIGVHVADNQAGEEGGGGLVSDRSRVELYNALFTYNTASGGDGGAVSIVQESTMSLQMATVVGNAAARGGAVFLSSSTLDIANSVFWRNPDPNGQPILAQEPRDASIAFSIVEGGTPSDFFDGSHVFAVDPEFVGTSGPDSPAGTSDADFHLRQGSPAIDAGLNPLVPKDTYDLDGDGTRGELLPFDLDGNARVTGGPTLGEVVDLGAYESSAILSSTEPSRRWATTSTCVLSAPYPNPTRGYLHVRIESPAVFDVGRLEIFDLLGRRVQAGPVDVLSGMPTAIRIDTGPLSGGPYFLRIRDSRGSEFCRSGFTVAR